MRPCLLLIIQSSLICVLVSGCTSLNAIKVNKDEQKDIKGVIYYLPESEFGISITRSLKFCGIATDPAFRPTGAVQSIEDKVVNGDPKSKFKSEYKRGDWIVVGYQARKVQDVMTDTSLTTTKPFTLKSLDPLPYEKPAHSIPQAGMVTEMQATAEGKIFPAGDQGYLINYEDLSSGLKQTGLTVELYENGTLKGINAAITDKTAEVSASLVKSGIAIAKMVMGTPPARVPTESIDSPCRSEVSQALMTLGMLNRSVKNQMRQRDNYISILQKIELLVTDRTSRDAVDSILKDLDNSQKELDLLEGKRKQIMGKLSVISQEHFRPTSTIMQKEFPPDDNILEDWFEKDDSILQDAKSKLTAVATVQVLTVPPGKDLCSKDDCDKGLVYRNPAQAFLHICQEKACLDASGNLFQAAEVLHKSRTVVPQLGNLARLPLNSYPFQSKTLTAAFAPDGTLTKLSATSEAAAEKAAAALADSLPSVSKLLEDQKASDVRSIKRETDRYKAEIEREKSRRELQDLLDMH